MKGCFYFYIGREPSMSPRGRMGQGLEQKEEWREPSMSPPGRMGQGLEQREEWREPSMSPLGRMEQGLEQREEGASRFRFILEEPIVL